MKPHFNLYYILIDDMRKNPLSSHRNQEIKKKIELLYRSIRTNQYNSNKQEDADEKSGWIKPSHSYSKLLVAKVIKCYYNKRTRS